MRAQLKGLTADTAVYGVSTILGRFLNFLLVPFYTNVFDASAYGIVTVVYTVIAFLNVVYALGLEQAYMRFRGDAGADARDVFSSPQWLIAGVGLLSTAIIATMGPEISGALLIPAGLEAIVPLAAATLLVDAWNVLPFASLRMQRRSTRFAVIRFTSIVINVALNLLFVLVFEMSVVAVFLAGLLASLSSSVMLLPSVRQDLVARWRPGLLRAMLRLGLPALPAGLALMVVQVLDRLLMQMLVDTRTAGIYGANYRLGIFMMLFVTMFQFAWQPFYLRQASQPGAERLFARVLTYFTATAAFVCLALALFIDDAATLPLPGNRTLLGTEYLSGLTIVPIVLLAYVFTGIDSIVSAGLLIRKRTGWMAMVTGAGAVVNIAANLVLIPRFGMTGGAVSTLAAYMTMAVLYWTLTQRIYPVPWEGSRLVRIAIALALPAVVWYLDPFPGLLPAPLDELALLLLFPLLLAAFGFFTPAERAEFRRMAALLRRR